MRVALPFWGGRLSPVFDVANRLLVIEIEGAEAVRQEEQSVRTEDPVAALSVLGVELLICGAISRELEDRVLSHGIEIIRDVRGTLSDVVQALLAGRILDGEHSMPGCASCRLRPG